MPISQEDFLHASAVLENIRMEVHILRMRLELRQIRRELIEQRYRPDQPRAPRGTPIGGQFIDDPLGAGQSNRLLERFPPTRPSREPAHHVAQIGTPSRPKSFYFVDLREEDRKGGHGFAEHVGRSRRQLLQVMEQIRYKTTLPDGTEAYRWHEAEGTFLSTGEASFHIQQALSNNPAAVERAIRGKVGDKPIRVTHRVGSQTGIEAYRPDYHSEVIFRPTFSVEIYIAHDPNRTSRGYRVITAFPMNEISNEEVK